MANKPGLNTNVLIHLIKGLLKIIVESVDVKKRKNF